MDIFVFSSTSETQGMVLVEAMAAGKPAIALDAPGCREVLRDGENGRLLPEKTSAEEFASAIEESLRQPRLCAAWSDGARRTAETFSRKVCSGKMEALYLEAFPLEREPDLLLMVKALVTAEGTVKLIDPAMDLVAQMRPHLRRLVALRFSPESIRRSIGDFLFRVAGHSGRFPRRISDIVEKMEKGKLRIGFEQLNLGGLQQILEKTFSRLTMGIILAAMIIGSSLIITAGVPPIFHGYPLLGLTGYLIAAILGLWLIFDILRNR